MSLVARDTADSRLPSPVVHARCRRGGAGHREGSCTRAGRRRSSITHLYTRTALPCEAQQPQSGAARTAVPSPVVFPAMDAASCSWSSSNGPHRASQKRSRRP
ncbi:Os09g0259900 [Oryza sativa Japonica Group]|uniref:Os09g0259900 protein n=1 Tax=Oryza sativa subsp. japonica TaxID=39947 RepID=A0A0P0XKC2_ORYSJ|nr:Os09g0259900 [Oryza sativa Japonica Group]